MRGQCKARNEGDTQRSYCLDQDGHEGAHYDHRENSWMHDQPHFPRVRRMLRWFVEADVTGWDEQEIALVRSEIEVAVRSVLHRNGLDTMVDRRRVREDAAPIATNIGTYCSIEAHAKCAKRGCGCSCHRSVS